MRVAEHIILDALTRGGCIVSVKPLPPVAITND